MTDTLRPAGDGPAFEAAVAYVPRILLEALEREPERLSPWCEWVEGTLVMADVSGFTAMSEKLAQAGKEGAEWLTDIINWYFGRMLDIASGCGGTTLTFGGDAILLLFYGEDHERRSIAASLRMLHATQDLPAYRVGNHRVKLSMSMGAHAGRFLTVSTGDRSGAQYLILGPETVCTAQAESAASSGELAIDAATAERVTGSAVLEPLGEHSRVERLVNAPRYGTTPPQRSPRGVPAEVLSPYLPPFVAEALAGGPDSVLPELDHEHRNVAVAFINVLGVDDLLESGGPAALADELQRYVEPAMRLAAEHHGYLVSNDIYLNGFKLIVAFGAPVAHEGNAANALRFATQLRDEISRAGVRLSHRIGINAGFVFAGDVGPSYRRQYTVMGDAVNLAARLMSAAEPGGIMASSTTVAQAQPGFDVLELEPIRVKGKEHPIPVCAVLGEVEVAAESEVAAATLVGREAELAALLRAAEAAAGGSVRVAAVVGEAGIGKSRLVAELESALDAQGGWRRIKAACYEHTSATPFAPWLRILEAVLGASRHQDTATRSAAVLAAVGRLVPDQVVFASLLCPLLELAIPESDVVASLDAGARRERLFRLVSSLVIASAREDRLVLQIEDVHWADSSSRALLYEVASAATSASLLLIVTSRTPPVALKGLAPESLMILDLGELPAEAAMRLVTGIIGLDELPESVSAAIISKSKGNPLFLQEVARSLSRPEVLERALRASDVAVGEEMAALELPDRVQALLMARIDTLPKEQRDLLRLASVIGPVFSANAVETLTGHELGQALAALEAAEMLETAGTGGAYRFRHALIQEVAYDSLRFSRRRDLHHRVGEYVEHRFAGRLFPHYEALAYHYRHSEDRTKTLRYATLAAEKASATYAHGEAIDYYRMALDATRARNATGAVGRSLLVERIGDCFELSGAHDEAARSFQDALRRWGPAQRLPAESLVVCVGEDAGTHESQLRHKVAVAYARDDRRFDLASRWIEGALETLPPGNSASEATFCVTKCSILLRQGAYEEMATWGRKGLELAREAGDLRSEAWALNLLALGSGTLGDYAAAIEYGREAVRRFEELGDLWKLAAAHSNLAISYHYVGDLAAAEDSFRTSIDLCERVRYGPGILITENDLADMLIEQGRLDEACGLLTRVVDGCRSSGTLEGLSAVALINLARIARMRGRSDEARRYLRDAFEIAPSEAAGIVEEGRLVEAGLALDSGDTEQAIAIAGRALTALRAAGLRLLEARALYVLGESEARRGDPAQGLRRLTEAVEVARSIGASYELALALLAQARVRRSAGRSDWRDGLPEAVSILSEFGSEHDLAEARRLESSPSEEAP